MPCDRTGTTKSRSGRRKNIRRLLKFNAEMRARKKKAAENAKNGIDPSNSGVSVSVSVSTLIRNGNGTGYGKTNDMVRQTYESEHVVVKTEVATDPLNMKAKILRLLKAGVEARVHKKNTSEVPRNRIDPCNSSVNTRVTSPGGGNWTRTDNPNPTWSGYEGEDLIVKTDDIYPGPDPLDIKDEPESLDEDEEVNNAIFHGKDDIGQSKSLKKDWRKTTTRVRFVKSTDDEELDSLIDLLYWLERYGTIIVTEDNENNIRQKINLFCESKIKVPQIEKNLEENMSPLINSNQRTKTQSDTINEDFIDPFEDNHQPTISIRKPHPKVYTVKRPAKNFPSDCTDEDFIDNSGLPVPVVPDLKNESSKLNLLHVKVESIARKYDEDSLSDSGVNWNIPYQDVTAYQFKPNLFLCEICGIEFDNVSRFKRHARVHVPGPRYLCEICPKSYRSISTLKEHRRVHTGETPYVCSVCGMRFAKDRNYHNHIVTHSSERKFKCTICPKTFRRTDHLKFHMRIHSGDKRYKCKPCNKSFVQIGSLIFHNKTHHTSTLLNNLLIL